MIFLIYSMNKKYFKFQVKYQEDDSNFHYLTCTIYLLYSVNNTRRY